MYNFSSVIGEVITVASPIKYFPITNSISFHWQKYRLKLLF